MQESIGAESIEVQNDRVNPGDNMDSLESSFIDKETPTQLARDPCRCEMCRVKRFHTIFSIYLKL